MFALMKSLLQKYYIPLTFVFLNIIIKILYISTEPISHDEPFTIYHAQFDTFNLIHYLKSYNNPPLFELIIHFWIKLFGISVSSVRVLPMLFSSLTVFYIFQIGSNFLNKKTAIIASLLFTFSNFQIWYAHDCRVYSLFLLLTTSSFYLFFKLLKNEKLSKNNVLFMLFINAALLYAHYFGAFVWLIEAFIIGIYYLKNKCIVKTFALIMSFSLLAYLPHIIILYQRFFDSAKNGTWLKAPVGIESLYNMLWSFTNAPVVAVFAIVLLMASVIKWLVTKHKRIQNPFVTYCVIWFSIPFFMMFMISYKIPMFLDRYLIFITPSFFLLLALSVSYLFSKKWLSNGFSGILILMFILSTSFNPSKKRLTKETVEFIKLKKNAQTIVLVCSPDFMTNFAYYYNRNYFASIDQNSEYGKMEKLLNKENIYFINTLDSNIYTTINNHNSIIYLDAGADFSSPENTIKYELLSNYKLKEEKFYPEIFHTYIFTKN